MNIYLITPVLSRFIASLRLAISVLLVSVISFLIAILYAIMACVVAALLSAISFLVFSLHTAIGCLISDPGPATVRR